LDEDDNNEPINYEEDQEDYDDE